MCKGNFYKIYKFASLYFCYQPVLKHSFEESYSNPTHITASSYNLIDGYTTKMTSFYRKKESIEQGPKSKPIIPARQK